MREDFLIEIPQIGDMVEVEGTKGLFVVVKMEDYTDEDGIDIDYEVMQVFPVRREPRRMNAKYENTYLYEKRGSEKYNIQMNVISQRRENYGYDEGEYVDIILQYEQGDISVIEYSKIKTVDECLDAINDLDFLYNKFKDEEYLQNKEVVIERLESLRS